MGRQFVASSYPSKDLEKLENQIRDTNSQALNVQSGGKPVQIKQDGKIMALETVQRKCCKQCLFSKNKIVSDARKDEILADCEKNNNHFECHKATIVGKHATCHAFYKQRTNPAISQMLENVGEVEFVDIR